MAKQASAKPRPITDFTAEELDRQARYRRETIEQCDANIEAWSKLDPKAFGSQIINLKTHASLSPKRAIGIQKRMRDEAVRSLGAFEAEMKRRAEAN